MTEEGDVPSVLRAKATEARLRAFRRAAVSFGPKGAAGVAFLGDHRSQRDMRAQAMLFGDPLSGRRFIVITHAQRPANGRPGMAKLYLAPKDGKRQLNQRRVVRITGRELARVIRDHHRATAALDANPALDIDLMACWSAWGGPRSLAAGVAQGLGRNVHGWRSRVGLARSTVTLSRGKRGSKPHATVPIRDLGKRLEKTVEPGRHREILRSTAAFPRGKVILPKPRSCGKG